MQLDDIYEDLLKITSQFGVDISSIEVETFFEELINDTELSNEEFLQFIRNNMPSWFKSVSYMPRWIQNSNWQFSNGKPMAFIGQLDIARASGIFHDDAAFYIFFQGDTGETKTIIQVA